MKRRLHVGEFLRGDNGIPLNHPEIHEPSALVIVHRTYTIQLLYIANIGIIWQEYSAVHMDIAVRVIDVVFAYN